MRQLTQQAIPIREGGLIPLDDPSLIKLVSPPGMVVDPREGMWVSCFTGPRKCGSLYLYGVMRLSPPLRHQIRERGDQRAVEAFEVEYREVANAFAARVLHCYEWDDWTNGEVEEPIATRPLEPIIIPAKFRGDPQPASRPPGFRYLQPWAFEWVNTDGSIWVMDPNHHYWRAVCFMYANVQETPGEWEVCGANIQRLFAESMLGVLGDVVRR